MRAFLELFAILAFSLVIGGGLSWYSIQNSHGFGALTIGQWTAWPLVGSQDADPYTKAKTAAQGDVPLGAAEGLAFHARTDSAGKLLRLECNYSLSGTTPPTRIWTLAIYASKEEKSRETTSALAYTHSQRLTRREDGKFDLAIGPQLSSGNWLTVDGRGPFTIIMRLYDSPITTSRSIVDPAMPSIVLSECAT